VSEIDALRERAQQWLDLSDTGMVRIAPFERTNETVFLIRDLLAALEAQRVPIRLEFDFRNPFDAFGLAELPEDRAETPVIRVNMAAILHLCVEDTEAAWREVTSDVVVHELLHVVQWALDKALVEADIDASILRVREGAELPDAEKDHDVMATVTEDRDRLAVRVKELEAAVEASQQETATLRGQVERNECSLCDTSRLSTCDKAAILAFTKGAQ
jgi:hypothetical protein